MTNATVAESVVGNDGHTLMSSTRTARRKSWSPGDAGRDLCPRRQVRPQAGAKVIAFMKKLPDGSFETNRVSVGRDGLTPPM
jgi:hypothetical protein